MAARKNRPDKHGASSTAALAAKQRQINGGNERTLIDKLIEWERAHPMHDHYVGWPDMDAAERLVKLGYLRAGGRATGCFVVTDAFRQIFTRADRSSL